MGSLDRSLSVSFGAVVLLLMTVFLAVAAVLSFQIQDQRQDFLATALAQSVSESVNRVNPYLMPSLLEDLQETIPGLGYVAVADRGQVLLAHSRSRLAGLSLAAAGLVLDDHEDVLWEGSHYWQRSFPLRGGLGDEVVGSILVGVSTDDLRRDQAWFLSLLLAVSLVGTAGAVATIVVLSRRFGNRMVAQLDQIIDKSPVGMVTSDLATQKVLRTNEQFTAAYGWSLATIPDVPTWFQKAYPDPEYRRRLQSDWGARVEESLRTGKPVPPFDVEITCADGQLRTATIASALVDGTAVVTFVDRTEQKQAERALRELNQSLEEKVRSRGEELERTYRELADTEKLAALGQLAAGMAHELNTPLGAIQSANGMNQAFLEQRLPELLEKTRALEGRPREWFLSLAQKNRALVPAGPQTPHRAARRELARALAEQGWEAEDDLVEYLLELEFGEPERAELAASPPLQKVVRMARDLLTLERMTRIVAEGVEKAAHVVDALRRYLKGKDEEELVRFRLEDQLETLLTLFHHKLKHGVEVVRRFEGDTMVVGDRQRLNQVWMNLIHNALQAMEFRGTLTLITRTQGSSRVVEVGDTGPGIPFSIQHRIFEPYFSTKKRGEGLGLGLDLCRRIVADHHGTLEFESRPGSTLFTVTLPSLQES